MTVAKRSLIIDAKSIKIIENAPIPVGVVLRDWEFVPTSKMGQSLAVDIACRVYKHIVF